MHDMCLSIAWDKQRHQVHEQGELLIGQILNGVSYFIPYEFSFILCKS